MDGINSYSVHKSIGGSPASVNLDTGHLAIGWDVYGRLSEEGKTLVLLHEFGHLHLQTEDEQEADRYAIEEFIKLGYDPAKVPEIYTTLLDPEDREHRNRINNIMRVTEFKGRGRARRKQKFESKIAAKQKRVETRSQNGGVLGQLKDTVVSAATAIRGNTDSQVQPEYVPQSGTEGETPKNNTIWYVVGGLVVIGVIVIVAIKKGS